MELSIIGFFQIDARKHYGSMLRSGNHLSLNLMTIPITTDSQMILIRIHTHTLSLFRLFNSKFGILRREIVRQFKQQLSIASTHFELLFLPILVESIHAMCTHLVFIFKKNVITALVGFLLMHSPIN